MLHSSFGGEFMTTLNHIGDLPVVKEVLFYRIEDAFSATSSHPFVHFYWHHEDVWIMGQHKFHTQMWAGTVYLRRSRGTKLYQAELLLHPQQQRISSIKVRKKRNLDHCTKYVFMGFDKSRQVDIDFIKSESQRISSPAQTDC